MAAPLNVGYLGDALGEVGQSCAIEAGYVRIHRRNRNPQAVKMAE